MLVSVFGISPREAWDLTTVEFWTLHDFKFDANKKKYFKPMNRSRFEELKAADEERQRRKKDGVK